MRPSLFLVALCVLCLGGLTACGNTVDGMGRDIENAGEKIQKL